MPGGGGGAGRDAQRGDAHGGSALEPVFLISVSN